MGALGKSNEPQVAEKQGIDFEKYPGSTGHSS